MRDAFDPERRSCERGRPLLDLATLDRVRPRRRAPHALSIDVSPAEGRGWGWWGSPARARPSPPGDPAPPATAGGQYPRGEIAFRGRDLLGMSDDEFARCAATLTMVFQEPMTSLNPLHSIGRQVGESAAAAPRPRGCDASADHRSDRGRHCPTPRSGLNACRTSCPAVSASG